MKKILSFFAAALLSCSAMAEHHHEAEVAAASEGLIVLTKPMMLTPILTFIPKMQLCSSTVNDNLSLPIGKNGRLR